MSVGDYELSLDVTSRIKRSDKLMKRYAMLGFDPAGRTSTWRVELPSAQRWEVDAGHGLAVIALEGSDGVRVRGIELQTGTQRFSTLLANSGGVSVHAVVVGADHVFVNYRRCLVVLDAKTGREVKRFGR